MIQENITYNNVGIVITDEQHRFGVYQRGALAENGKNPDVLIMSATPIPRTLALSLYGDMEVSKIEVLPKGRLPIKTYAVNSSMRERIYKWIHTLVESGERAYIVHPLISDENQAEDSTLLSAEKNYETLSKTIFSDIPTALIHGKMSAAEKDNTMSCFTKGDIKVLFSTTVIEVGVDVPEASVIVVENAERFGLAQLHQLRGRVGRSDRQSYCVLVTDNEGELTKKRLDTMVRTTNGFEIAEMDLQLRGPGDFFGTAQHGLPVLKIANLYEDIDLLKKARDAADILLKKNDPYVDNILDRINKKITSVY